MDDTLRTIKGVSEADKAAFVSLLRSRNYREVGILDTPGESEYSARSHIRDFSGADCDMEWSITWGVRRKVE